MGALIIQEVVRELLGKGLSGAKVLLLAGSRWAGQGLGWESGYGAGGQGHARREPQRVSQAAEAVQRVLWICRCV